ncbi:MAG: hypothetical protein ACLRSW_11510 [Christensenellaceae bacterium]
MVRNGRMRAERHDRVEGVLYAPKVRILYSRSAATWFRHALLISGRLQKVLLRNIAGAGDILSSHSFLIAIQLRNAGEESTASAHIRDHIGLNALKGDPDGPVLFQKPAGYSKNGPFP